MGETNLPPPPLKILIFAGVPPPIHGQNLMVAALIEGLGKNPAFKVVHINPQLSARTEDVGHGSTGKLFRLLLACGRALRTRWREGPMIFYYVPAPAKTIPVCRDWIVMFFCRPFFSTLVLHWHAVGLGAWIQEKANPFIWFLTRRALGRAELAIVLAPELAADAEVFRPRKILVVANGIVDPVPPDLPKKMRGKSHYDVLFLGLGSEAKGLFAALAAIQIANTRTPGRFRFIFAGNFATAADEARFAREMEISAEWVRRVGLVSGLAKATLLRESDLLCFPTCYAHEGQPLVLIEALAFDLPIVTTRWRAIPGMLPEKHVWFAEAAQPEKIADAVELAGGETENQGELRDYFLSHFTIAHHLAAMTRALSSLDLETAPFQKKKPAYATLR